jgi:hypothetical protein
LFASGGDAIVPRMMVRRLVRISALIAVLAMAAGLGACSKCDVSGFFKGCQGSVPKS